MQLAIVDALAQLIDHSGLFSRAEWAEFLGVRPSAISQWVRGHTLPRPSHAWMMLEALRSSSRIDRAVLSRFEAALDEPLASEAVANIGLGRGSMGERILAPMERQLRVELAALPFTEREQLLMQFAELARERVAQIESGEGAIADSASIRITSEERPKHTAVSLAVVDEVVDLGQVHWERLLADTQSSDLPDDSSPAPTEMSSIDWRLAGRLARIPALPGADLLMLVQGGESVWRATDTGEEVRVDASQSPYLMFVPSILHGEQFATPAMTIEWRSGSTFGFAALGQTTFTRRHAVETPHSSVVKVEDSDPGSPKVKFGDGGWIMALGAGIGGSPSPLHSGDLGRSLFCLKERPNKSEEATGQRLATKVLLRSGLGRSGGLEVISFSVPPRRRVTFASEAGAQGSSVCIIPLVGSLECCTYKRPWMKHKTSYKQLPYEKRRRPAVDAGLECTLVSPGRPLCITSEALPFSELQSKGLEKATAIAVRMLRK